MTPARVERVREQVAGLNERDMQVLGLQFATQSEQPESNKAVGEECDTPSCVELQQLYENGQIVSQ